MSVAPGVGSLAHCSRARQCVRLLETSCTGLRHLAHHLAVEYPALVPAADQGRLTPHEARQLLNAVRPWQLQQRTNQHLDTSAHLSVWHALSITHPDIGDAARPAQVCQLLHCAWHREVGLYVSPCICEVEWHVALALAS